MTPAARYRSGLDLISRLSGEEPLFTVEIRPPRRDARTGVDHWIDMYHSIRKLSGADTLVFTTDSAVGSSEEESLRHLDANLGGDADLSKLVPFLTSKHPLDYCLRFPERAHAAGHRSVVVLGGDRSDQVARCVEHAVELRRMIRERSPSVALGGWANPYRDASWQVDLLKAEEGVTDYFLTQVVSHHDLAAVERFLAASEREKLAIPAVFGLFYYRSGNPRTLTMLRSFLPVPIDGISADFAAGADAMSILKRSIDGLRGLGVRRFYICNLEPGRSAEALGELTKPV